MATPNIPANSLLSTQFSEFRVKPQRADAGKFFLIAKGDELNTVWFEDRPLRGYGHFDFDEITGRTAWNKLFNGDNPNSILSGQGRSLVFETGHFKTRSNGTYVSNVKLVDGQVSQDVITGQWKKSSLLIDPTSDPDDNSTSIVEGLAGLLVVGGGFVLYKKLRASRVQEAAEEDIDQLQQDIEKANADLAEAEDRFTANAANLADNSKALNELQANLAKSQSGLANAEKQLELSKQFPNNDKTIKLWQNEVNEWQKEVMSTQKQLSPLRAKYDRLTAESLDIKRELKSINDNLDILQDEQRAVNRLARVIEEELEESLAEVANDADPYDTSAFKANQGDIELGQVDEVKVLTQIIDEDLDTYKGEVIKAVKNEFGDGFTESMKGRVDNILSEASEKAYNTFVEATCSVPVLAKGAKARGGKRKGVFAGAICTDIEGIDPIVDVYAEEFTIERNMIFKGSNVFDELRSNLADIGYEAEVGQLTEFVSGPEFAGEAGELISAVTEGTLAAEDAVGALDIASIGLGGEAFVDGLALEVGGDALLGEIALDILEIAIFL